jgi:hypothetical protein
VSRFGFDLIYTTLSEKYHWTPMQIGEMTLPQVDLYMRSDRIVEDLSKGRDPNRIYFNGTPEEQMEQLREYRRRKAETADEPKIWRLS